jgi:DNA polymerase-3 subunit delta'
MGHFDSVLEQEHAKRLLGAALENGPAHAYLLHGPAGVGKTTAALAFAGALLGDAARVEKRIHPDLRVVEALGEMIRIDRIRELHHDLHMRPYEGDRRVYVLLDAHLLNEDAADALLKDLEEPPSYATIVLVADELGPLPETIRSRCQLVPFRRLSERAVRDWLAATNPELGETELATLARMAGGRLDRARRLVDPAARERREALIRAARGVYRDPAFDVSEGAAAILAACHAAGEGAREAEEQAIVGLDLPARDAEQRVRRAQRGAEKEELLAGVEQLAAWYRDLVAVAAGTPSVAFQADRLDDLIADAALPEVASGADLAVEHCRATWRVAEELNVNPQLALEALFVRLRLALGAAGAQAIGA